VANALIFAKQFFSEVIIARKPF